MEERPEKLTNLVDAEELRRCATELLDAKIFAGEASAERDTRTGIENFEYIDNDLRVNQADGGLVVTYSLVEGPFSTDHIFDFPDGRESAVSVVMSQYMGGRREAELHELSGQDAREVINMVTEEMIERYGS